MAGDRLLSSEERTPRQASAVRQAPEGVVSRLVDKPHQAALTKEKFDDWYRTEVSGKSFELGAHLGKGTDRDPQTTIRIAFTWDDEQDRVIVGSIGLHQRNRLG